MTKRVSGIPIGFFLLALGHVMCRAERPAPTALATFSAYAEAVEARLARQHESDGGFLGTTLLDRRNVAPLSAGELVVEQLTPPAALPGAMLHHWRATEFVAGATAEGFDETMRDFGAWPRIYAPEVLAARELSQQGDQYGVAMRVRQRHVLTVVMDMGYDVKFGRLNAQHRFSASRSTHIAEIDAGGHALSPADEHGYLWRENTYWSCVERDGGVYLQVESISLTRSIPIGLAWAIGPFVESVPRDSLEFMLRATGNELRRAQ